MTTAFDLLLESQKTLPIGARLESHFLILLALWSSEVGPSDLVGFTDALRALYWRAFFNTLVIATTAITRATIPQERRAAS
jgi:hypothetical protein